MKQMSSAIREWISPPGLRFLTRTALVKFLTSLCLDFVSVMGIKMVPDHTYRDINEIKLVKLIRCLAYSKYSTRFTILNLEG